MKILDYNRVVKDLNGLTVKEFLYSVNKSFRVTPISKPQKTPSELTFLMFLDNIWYNITKIDSINRQNILIKRQNTLLMIGIAILAAAVFI